MRDIIINVNSCVDMTYFMMFFYEPIHNGLVLLYDVSTIEEIGSLKDEIRKDLDRISFGENDCQLLVCVPRQGSEQNLPEYTDLFYRIQVSEIALSFAIPFKKICILVTDLFSSHEDVTDKINENQDITSNGFVSYENDFLPGPSFWSKGTIEEFVLTLISRVQNLTNEYCREFYSAVSEDITIHINSIRESQESLQPEIDDYPAIFTEYYKARKMKYLDRLVLLNISIFDDEPAARLITYLQIAAYISNPERMDLSKEGFQDACRNFSRDQARKNLFYYQKRFERAQDIDDSNTLGLEKLKRANISRITEFEEDVVTFKSEAISGFLNTDAEKSLTPEAVDHWIQRVCTDVDDAENRLSRFADDLVGNYCAQKPKLEIETVKEISRKEEELRKKRIAIIEEMSKGQNSGNGMQFKDQTEIRSYIKQVGLNLNYWIECLHLCKKRLFLLTWIAALTGIIVPYTWIQSYVFLSIKGVIFYFLYLAVVGGLFFLVFGLVRRSILRDIKKEVNRINSYIDEYFNEYIKRAKNFQDKVYLQMDNLTEIEAETEQIQKWKIENALLEKKMRWHGVRIKETRRMLAHFQLLIDKFKSDEIQPDEDIQIDYNKDDVNNPFYWMIKNSLEMIPEDYVHDN